MLGLYLSLDLGPELTLGSGLVQSTKRGLGLGLGLCLCHWLDLKPELIMRNRKQKFRTWSRSKSRSWAGSWAGSRAWYKSWSWSWAGSENGARAGSRSGSGSVSGSRPISLVGSKAGVNNAK